ncbi:2-deoxyglucose-6-phosphatase [Orobanche gracilis]
MISYPTGPLDRRLPAVLVRQPGNRIASPGVPSWRGIGNLGELSGNQISMVDELQRRTIREEKKLSERLASLQDDMLDHPLADISVKSNRGSCRSSGNAYGAVEAALDKHGRAMAGILTEADELRLNTLREFTKILMPRQAVDFLAAGKKLRLCMQDWGKKRDLDHGRDLL